MAKAFRAAFGILALSAAAGCRSLAVEMRKPVLGPVAEVGYIDPGGGHLRYALRGGGFLVKCRRSDALKRARRHCAQTEKRAGSRGKPGAVRIVKEWSQEDGDVIYHSDDLDVTLKYDLDHYRVEPYQHLLFECERSP